MKLPRAVELVGNTLVVRWDDSESFLEVALLRAKSPSAEVAGEVDIMGAKHGGEAAGRSYAGILLLGWEVVGSYGLRLIFSDGHRTGIYSWDYLRQLEQA
jgi:DUF971 family protein